jgi:hypothetical protein
MRLRDLRSLTRKLLETGAKDYFIITLVAATLALIWFRSGLIIAYAEPGLYTFNSDAWREISSYTWIDKISTGTSSLGITLASLSFHLALSLLQTIGFTPFEKQVTLFFTLLTVAGSSMHYLARGSFTKHQGYRESGVTALFASMFYVLNPYSMVYIWNRNTVGMNVAYATLPLALALYMRGLESKNPKYAFYASIVLTASSIWVSIVPILVPMLLLSFLLFRIYTSRRNRKEILSFVRYSGLLALMWFMMNSWFLPYFAVSLNRLWWGFSSNYSQQYLSGFPILDVLRLNFDFSSNDVFWPFYQTALGSGLGAIMVLSVLGGILFVAVGSLRKNPFERLVSSERPKVLGYFAVLAILGIFLGSVALTPLKIPVSVMLAVLPLSASVSNNMIGEKAILLSAIGYSILFGFTMSSIRQKIGTPFKARGLPFQLGLRRTLIGILLLLVLVFNVWPMWTGDLFTQPYIPAAAKLGLVKVPGYYDDASAWLNSDPSYFRVLTLPFVEGGITYDWPPYGYSGSTTDFVLLPKPVIMEANDPVSNDVIRTVSHLIDSGQMDNAWKLMSILNVKYIMVHEDINFTDRNTLSPFVIEASLNSTSVPYINIEPVRDDRGSPITNSTKIWSITWGTQPGIVEIGSEVQGNTYIQYVGHSSSDGLGDFGYGPTFTQPLDLSTTKWLDVSLQSNLSGKLFLAITDKSGKSLFFDGRTNPQYYSLYASNQWSNFSLPLRSPSYENAGVDLGSIRSILLSIVDLPPNVQVDMKAKDLMIDRGAIESPVPRIEFLKRIGKLAFYKVGGMNSIVYPTTGYSIVNSSAQLAQEVQFAKYEPNRTLLISSQFGDLSELGRLTPTGYPSPSISVRRASPVKWVVEVRNSRAPFILEFGETFDSNWKLYLGEPGWLGGFSIPSLDERLHYLVNGYANAWYVDKTGDFSITIYNSAQSLVSMGTLISLLTTLLVFTWLFRKNAARFLRKISRARGLRARIESNALANEPIRVNDGKNG